MKYFQPTKEQCTRCDVKLTTENFQPHYPSICRVCSRKGNTQWAAKNVVRVTGKRDGRCEACDKPKPVGERCGKCRSAWKRAYGPIARARITKVDRKRYKKRHEAKKRATKIADGTFRLRLCLEPYHQVATNNHRVKKNFSGDGDIGKITLSQWRRLMDEYDNLCAYCYEAKPLCIDHIVPLTLGGLNDIGNIQPLCVECNSSKGNRLPMAA